MTTVLVPADGSTESYLFSQFQNVTDRKASEDALAHQGLHDSLTGLPNRSLLERRLARALREDYDRPTVLFVDIDNFTVIDDGLGHTVGDRLLVELARRLESNTRDDDTVARFGGDLKSLPLTTLKVDRSFVDGLGQDPYATSIVEAIVALGHSLGMRVHAEGVERADQLDELRRVGCDDAQGWLWAPAMTSGDFEDWMETRQS